MLYGYALGEMISCHDGVRCYPASRRDTDQAYILKVISIPASRSKLDALLLAGALSDEKAALAYFRNVAKDLIRQTELLQQLSQQEGFVSYLSCDMCRMEGETGYYVCLLGTYKESLEEILCTKPLTHADILHMGLDLCAALAACRRAGMLYADLKPGNIFFDPEQGCRIGDVGFIPLSSLNYSCLPDKYRSSYTAPELFDDFAVLNPTVDVYALGMILYRAYNGGRLPFEGPVPAMELPAPLYADYEMAQILNKACHPDPAQRWQDPTQLAQALMRYMQQFGAPETPIIPSDVEIPEEDEAEEVEEFLPEADPEQLQAEMDALEEDILQTQALQDALDYDKPISYEAEEAAEITDEDTDSNDLGAILALANDLIGDDPSGEIPEFAEASQEAEVEEPGTETTDAVITVKEELTPEHADSLSVSQEETTPKKRRFPLWIPIAALLLLAALIVVYFLSGHNLRVQSLVLSNTADCVTVQVLTEEDESLLRVLCTDNNGYSRESMLVGGIAAFDGLQPATQYTVRILAAETYRVTGQTGTTFTTCEETTVSDFTAAIGPEDCSVILSFAVHGPEADGWTVRYEAEGIPPQTHSFTGYTTTIFNLVDGAEYTFTLEPQTPLYIAGTTSISYRATNILYAKDLQVFACGEGSLTLQWQQPENGTAALWQVRCYNDAGYNVTATTEACSYTFTELSHDSPCTVEVTAAGMNRSVSIQIPANPITIQNFTCTVTDEMALWVTWEHMGPAPVGGWLIRVSIDGAEAIQIETEKQELLLALLPGSHYSFHFVAAPGSCILQDQHSYSASDIAVFAAFGLDASGLSTAMCLQPKTEVRDWPAYLQENRRDSFAIDETAAILLQSATALEPTEDAVNVQFVISRSDGTPLHLDSASMIWSGMWKDGCCCLSLPYLPESPGSYTLVLYFDGQFVSVQEFTVV